jgi:hypothetical protein
MYLGSIFVSHHCVIVMPADYPGPGFIDGSSVTRQAKRAHPLIDRNAIYPMIPPRGIGDGERSTVAKLQRVALREALPQPSGRMHRTRNSVAAISASDGPFCSGLFSLSISASPSTTSRFVSPVATGSGSKMVAKCSAFVRRATCQRGRKNARNNRPRARGGSQSF